MSENDDNIILNHISPVTHLTDLAAGRKSTFLQTLEEARQQKDAALIFEGDYGGTVFATIPIRHLPQEITHQDICQLGLALEKSFWGCNIDNDCPEGGYGVYYRISPPGSGVIGGMGGGRVVDGLWVHPNLSGDEQQLIKNRLKL